MVKIKYVFKRGDTFYWQRKVPTDLVHRYPSSAPLKINLQTMDPKAINSKVGKLNRQYEALWEAMRRDHSLTPETANGAAKVLLRKNGLTLPAESNDPAALAQFFDKLDVKRESYAKTQDDPEEAYRDSALSDFLSKPEVEAVDLLGSRGTFLISDAMEVYLEEHPKRGKLGFDKLESDTRRAIGKLTSFIGDKVFVEVTRGDAKAFRAFLSANLKSESVRRNLNVVRAVFQSAINEKSIHAPNVFHSLTVAGLGEDSESGEPFSDNELATLRRLCREKDDAVRWILAIQAETGARLAEIVGLGTDDIHVDGEKVPYLAIRPRPWRSLKNSQSKRDVPLVGIALWAATRALSAAQAEPYLFPRYVENGKLKGGSASATVNKWLKSVGLEHTSHDLRHTMKDRLRNSGATRDIQHAIGGWGRREVADGYGKGYALEMLHSALVRTLPAEQTQRVEEFEAV